MVHNSIEINKNKILFIRSATFIYLYKIYIIFFLNIIIPLTFVSVSIILGEPDDKFLRKVEKDVLVPKLMRERTKTEKCIDEVKGNHIHKNKEQYL